MTEAKHRIRTFAAAGREHLNAGERVRAVVWSLLVFGAVALLSSLPFVLRGFRVDRRMLALPLVVAAGVAAVFYLRRRFSHRKAVGHADRFFGMKEGLITADEHIREGREEEIHHLQLEHTRQTIQPHDPAALRGAFPRKVFGLALLLIVVSGSLLVLEDSLAVQQARAEAVATQALSEELAEELGEALDDLTERVDADAAEMLEDPALKKMLRELPVDGDRKALMRQLSEIDRHLSMMQNELDTRADENYLAELAQQLRQSRETSALGKALSQRKYKQAADELNQMQLGPKDGAAKQKTLEKLASKIEQTEKSMASSQSGSRRDARAMSQQIQQMQQEQKNSGQCSKECQNKVNESLGKSGSGMKQLGARKQAKSALDQLRKKLQQGQSQCAGNGDKPGNGLQAGEGVDRSRRNPRESPPPAGTLEHLSGQLGEGESQKRIEDAASGAGVASDPGTERAADDYTQQVEAFVQREDIPEEMKHGVKTYFKQIHNLDAEESLTK